MFSPATSADQATVPNLRKMLASWAVAYTTDTLEIGRIVDATIAEVIDSPHKIYGQPADDSLRKILRAKAKKHLRPRPVEIDIFQQRGRSVVRLYDGKTTTLMPFINERFAKKYASEIKKKAAFKGIP